MTWELPFYGKNFHDVRLHNSSHPKFDITRSLAFCLAFLRNIDTYYYELNNTDFV